MLRELFYRQILKELKGAKTIIDVGAGNSVYRYIYKKRKIKFYEFARIRDFNVTAIDINPENKNILKMDFRDIKKEYDVFFSSHFLEHIVNPMEYMNIVKKYCRKYVVTITDKLNKEFWNEPTHIRPYTIQSIKSLYGWFNFRPIKTFSFGKTFCVIGEKGLGLG